MTTFYLYAAAISVIALLVLLRPWWLARFTATHAASEDDAMRALNTAIYRDQISDLERDRAAGQLAETDYVEARDELQRRLLDDTRGNVTAGTAAKGFRGLWIALALVIPVGAFSLYMVLGSPDAVLSVAQQDARANASIEKMVSDLAKRLEEKPDNPQGWAMLGRSYAALGRYEEGEKAFGRIGPALEQSPELLGAFAEFLVRKAGGDFSGRPRELIAKSLQLDPENMMGLYLAGVDAIQNQRWNEVIKYWEPLLKNLEPGSDDADSIGAGLEQARQKVGPGKTAPSSKATAKKPVAATGKTLSGRIELAPALRAKVKADDVLFISARAEGGPPMPLAALRLKVADLPYAFTLSDENALGAAQLSTAPAVRIVARVAKGGTATTSVGDLTGQSGVVKPGDKGIRILIENEIK